MASKATHNADSKTQTASYKEIQGEHKKAKGEE